MKRGKRKYTHKVPAIAPESTTEPIKEIGGSEITQAALDILPLSLRVQLEAVTKARARAHLLDNLKERTEAMVRRFKGDRPR